MHLSLCPSIVESEFPEFPLFSLYCCALDSLLMTADDCLRMTADDDLPMTTNDSLPMKCMVGKLIWQLMTADDRLLAYGMSAFL